MRYALLATLLAAVATPALAGDFVANGEHYTYTSHRTQSGDVLLNGNAGLDAFALRVHGNRVNGTMGVSTVSFTVSPDTIARLNAEVPAAEQQTAAVPATLASN